MGLWQNIYKMTIMQTMAIVLDTDIQCIWLVPGLNSLLYKLIRSETSLTWEETKTIICF